MPHFRHSGSPGAPAADQAKFDIAVDRGHERSMRDR